MSETATLSNTQETYGSVTKTFHWLTALLILTAFPLGMIANAYPYDTSDQLVVKAALFSAHKTVGITAFFVALARILWTLSQPKPGLLNADHRLEAFAAELVHWMLYVSIVIVPLSGWLHHAATEGFAPIWWPFGQTLPMVPKSEAVAAFFGGWHFVFTKVLGLSVLLHIAGAVKHHAIDRDSTLRRMLPGRVVLNDLPDQHATSAPLFTALAIWAVAIAGGSALGLAGHSDGHEAAETVTLEVLPSQWQVESGTLSISVRQLGSDVLGTFDTWSAAIDFDPEATGDTMGAVTVEIAIASLHLGSVSAQALDPSFLDAAGFPTATFTANILRADDGYLADGVLTLRGVEAPVQLPFSLTLEGDRAAMQGTTTLDRRTFEVGLKDYKDEANVGFPVTVNVELTAHRSE